MVEQGGLPVAQPLGHELAFVVDVLEIEADEHLFGRVLVEESDEVGAKLLVLGAPRELHFTPPDPRTNYQTRRRETDARVRKGSASVVRVAPGTTVTPR